MGNDTDIKARLLLEDAATKTLDGIKAGFGKVDTAINFTKNELVGFVKQSAAMALGFQFDRGIQSIKGWAHEAMDAAKVAGTQAKSIATVLAVNDKTGKSFDELKKDGAAYRKELQDLAIATGTSSAAVIDAFEDISERSNNTAAQNETLVKQMIQAGKVVPSGLAGITEGYRMMEMGMIRAKNPLVQLIASTHMLKGNAKDVAKQLTAMGSDKAMSVANSAIGYMANKAGNGPLTGGQVIQSIKDMSDQVMETAGGALLKAMAKPQAVIRELFLENKAGLEQLYTQAGNSLGEVIGMATDKAKEGITYIKAHGAEIKADIKEAWSYAKTVVQFFLDHRKEIAAAFIISKAAPMMTGAAGGIADAATGGYALLSSATRAASSGVTALSGATQRWLWPLTATTQAGPGFSKSLADMRSSIAGNVSPAMALSAAMGGLMLAWDQMNTLMTENKYLVQSLGSAIGGFLGTMKYKTADMLENEAAQREAQQYRINEIEASAEDKRLRIMARTGEALARLDPSSGIGADGLVKSFNDAASANNKGAEKYAAAMMLSSGLTVDYLKKAGFQLAGGLTEFLDVIGDSADPAKLKKFLGEYDPKKVNIAPHIDFSGSKFEIHQDFRNEDPERIMLMFRRDILKSAEHRRQSRLGTAFGL